MDYYICTDMFNFLSNQLIIIKDFNFTIKVNKFKNSNY